MHEDNFPVNFARPMPNWQPLVEYRRNGVAENTIGRRDLFNRLFKRPS